MNCNSSNLNALNSKVKFFEKGNLKILSLLYNNNFL